MEIKTIRKLFERRVGERINVQKTIESLRKEIREKINELTIHEQAQTIIKEVGMKTQQSLQFHISDITSLALGAVFPDPYELSVEFVERRNKTECDLMFVRGESKIDPLSASGGGAVDVAAFALRIASWSMQMPHTRNTIILDEPLRFVSENLQEQASMMIKEISKKLGIQFIIVTHNQILTSYADKVFETSMRSGKSKVKTN